MKALILMLLLSGCSLLTGGASASLDGEWQLQAGTNQGQPIPIVAGSRITLNVDGTQVGGIACNHYGGTIQVNGASIVISALSMTEMACQEPLMASEAAYLAALQSVTEAERDGNSLVLSGPQVELRYGRVAELANSELVGTTWTLESLISGEAVSSTLGEQVTLTLSADGTITASTGCREVSGRYTIADGQVQVTLDPYDTIGCAAPLEGQDAHVLAVISDGFAVSIEGDRLTLSAGGKGLGYRAG